jgi:ribosome biogenesis GTPase A
MHKARKDIEEVLPQMDVMIEVLDARLPFSSENPLVREIQGDKPCIKLLNKADMADPEKTAQWVAHFEAQQNVRAIPVSQEDPEAIRDLLLLCNNLIPHRNLTDVGARVIIMGIPNVGKSTIINTLAERKIAKTGNEAGVTITQQRIKLPHGVSLTDTPGFLWPKLNPPTCGYRLAASGGIKDTVFEWEDVGLFTADYLLKTYPERLMARYQFTELPLDDEALIEAVGRKRGALRKGGVVEMNQAAKALVVDFRNLELGRITLETPDMISGELEAAKSAEASKVKEKAERDADRRKRYLKNKR